MRDPDPSPADGGPTRRGRRRRGELAGEAVDAESHALSGLGGIPPGPPAGPPRRPEDAIASRSTSTEAADLVAFRRARQGDDASFAEVLRNDDDAVTRFVAALVGPGAVEPVVLDTYVKAYRGLPVAPDGSPRLWLLRLAVVACADDERRRTRHRLRERPERGTPAGPPEPPPIPVTLPEEQRIVLALVDAAGLTVREASKVVDVPPAEVGGRLRAARRAHARPPEAEAVTPEVDDRPARLTGLDRAATHSPGFWNDVGEALLRARSTPADRAAARPAQIRVQSDRVRDVGLGPPRARTRPDTARTGALRAAERARHEPSTFPLAKVAMFAGAAVTAVVVVATAAWLVQHATSRDASLGVTAAKVLTRVDGALSTDRTIAVTAVPSEAGASPARLVRTSDGSYRVTSGSPRVDEAWDAATLRATRVADAGAVGNPAAELIDVQGVAPGSPDVVRAVGGGLGDPLLGAVRLTRAARGVTVTTTTVGGSPAWVLSGSLATAYPSGGGVVMPGVGSSGEGRRGDTVRLTVDQSLLLPVRFELRRDGRVVSDVHFRDYAVNDPVPASSFTVEVPAADPGRASSGGAPSDVRGDWGFRTTGLDEARAQASNVVASPDFVPDGFELTTVALRSAVPSPAPPDGLTDGAGSGSPVVVLVYRRGSSQLVVTCRPADGLPDPFAGRLASLHFDQVRLSTGRFAGRVLHRATAPVPVLWVSDGRSMVTVTGDVSPDEARRVAASLR